MEKIRIGIVGYGNIGKGVELAIARNEDMELKAVFTRRNPESVSVQTEGVKVVHMDDVLSMKDDIDVMMLCGGSATDLPVMGPEMAAHFNTIDSFDTHAKIPEYFANVDAAAKAAGNIGIISVGWDPGMFSLNRIYAESILVQGSTYTFWGKGVSQGHSDALRQIDGVEDAIQYTIPASRHIQKIRTDYDFVPQKNEMHIRECFVAIKKGANKKQIEQQIKNMENYFKGQEVQIHFVKKELIEKLKKRMYHAGQIIGSGKDMSAQIRFYVKMKSNPTFTANIMTKYINAIKHLPFGVYSVADIAPRYLLEDYESLL